MSFLPRFKNHDSFKNFLNLNDDIINEIAQYAFPKQLDNFVFNENLKRACLDLYQESNSGKIVTGSINFYFEVWKRVSLTGEVSRIDLAICTFAVAGNKTGGDISLKIKHLFEIFNGFSLVFDWTMNEVMTKIDNLSKNK